MRGLAILLSYLVSGKAFATLDQLAGGIVTKEPNLYEIQHSFFGEPFSYTDLISFFIIFTGTAAVVAFFLLYLLRKVSYPESAFTSKASKPREKREDYARDDGRDDTGGSK